MEVSLQLRYQNQPEIAEIVDRCRFGQQSAFKELYDRYIKAMYNTSFRIVNSQRDADDAVQEAFTEAFRNIDNFDGRSTFGHWLKRIVVNKSINQLRKNKLELVGIDHLKVVSVDEGQTDESFTTLTIHRINESIQRLPTGYRTVLSLYLIEGYDHQEIAQILNVAESTTRTQYIRAKKKLRDLLNATSL